MNKKQLLSFTIGPIGASVLGFASLPIVAWFFSPENIGRIAILQVVSNFSVILFSLGLDEAYIREYHESNDKATILKNTVIPGLLLLIATSLGLILFDATQISKALFSIDSGSISLLVISFILASFITRFLSLILRMQERGMAYSMTQLLPKILFIVIIIGYVLFVDDFDFIKLFIANVCSIVAVMITFVWYTRKEWLPAVGMKLDIMTLTPMLRFGLPLIFGGMSSWALMAMDKLFLRTLSSFEELGIYSIAAGVAAAAGIFSGIFNTVWAPTVYKWAVAGINMEKINRTTEHVLAAAFYVFTISGLFSWLLQYLLPKNYDSVQYLVTACMAVPLLYTLAETSAVGIGIARKTSYSMIASFLAASVNFAGNYWLVPNYGASGAAAATAFSFWVFLVCRTELSCRIWRRIPRLKLYMTTFACVLVSVSSAIIGKYYQGYLISIWLTLGIIGFWIFRHSFHAAKIEILSFRSYIINSRNI